MVSAETRLVICHDGQGPQPSSIGSRHSTFIPSTIMQRPTSRTLASLLRCTGSKGTLTRSANSRPFSGGFLGPRSLAFQRESLALEKLLSNRRTLGASVTRSRPIHIGTGSDRARRSSTSAVWGRVGWSAVRCVPFTHELFGLHSK